MKEINLNELKEIQLDMLKFVKNICEVNNLKYFLCGGTLLGAVRHQGYIPWDDDIDIFMPIEDYKKFIKIIKDNNEIAYSILDPYDNDEYYYFFSKLIDNRTVMIEDNMPQINGFGVYIDIFPIYGLPNYTSQLDDYVDKMLQLNDIYKVKACPQTWNYSKNKFKKIIKSIVKFPMYCKYKNIASKKRILSLLEENNYNKTKYVGYILSAYEKKEILDKRVFDKAIPMKFEDEYFNVPIGYDQYLKQIYGDYMKLPPLEKRQSHHNFTAWWKEISK